MNKFALVSVLVLIVAWGYTSWYWYVCNIKDLCYEVTLDSDTQEQWDIIVDKSYNNSNIMTADDVLSENEPWESQIEDVPSEEEVVEVWEQDDESGSWAIQILEEEKQDNAEWTDDTENLDTPVEEEEWEVGVTDSVSLCVNPLIGPIGLGGDNNREEVERLEAFLISRWENLEIDGKYGQNDFDAIKRFQLEFREEILDPWDIENPTGYVFRTTIKTINQVACK